MVEICSEHGEVTMQDALDKLVLASEDGRTFGLTITDKNGIEFLIIPVNQIIAYEDYIDGTKILIRYKLNFDHDNK
jgi:hypothetical protein